MSRPTVSTSCVVLVVIRRPHDGRFLLIQEADAHGRGTWYVPGGSVEIGEDIVTAARREVAEEAGATINLQGLLRITQDLRLSADGNPWVRWRFVFLAEPTAASGLKSTSDEHSLAASWFARDEISDLPLRLPIVPELLALADHGPLLPMSALRITRPTMRSTDAG